MVNLEDFHKHILECYPQEGCGFIVDDIFYPVANVHSDPTENFLFPEDISFSLCDKEYKILHSHTMLTFKDDPRTPSYTDMRGMDVTKMPWGIVHCDGENVTDILWVNGSEITELLGRSYICNVYDCFTLANDYYRLNYNINFGIHPRPPDWQSWNPHYINQTYSKLGFTEVESPKVGDILLFAIGSGYNNHIGIYIGEGKFIHHLHKRKSEEDNLHKWKNHLYKALRHKDVK